MLKKTLTYAGAGLGLSAALVLGTGAAAFAHECYNPNRSDQGNANATHSENWFTLVLPDLLQEEVENGIITQEQADCVIATYTATGAPLSFTVMTNDTVGVIAANNPNDHLATNGKGIDHAFAAYGEEIFGSYAACVDGF